MMTADGEGVQQAGYSGGTPRGNVGSDQERGGTGLQVFKHQFSIDQFFM